MDRENDSRKHALLPIVLAPVVLSIHAAGQRPAFTGSLLPLLLSAPYILLSVIWCDAAARVRDRQATAIRGRAGFEIDRSTGWRVRQRAGDEVVELPESSRRGSATIVDELTDRVHAGEPDAAHTGQWLLNSRDFIFRESGTQLILPVVE